MIRRSSEKLFGTNSLQDSATPFALLESEIGEVLFKELSYSDKIFLIETAGSVDFGGKIDLKKVLKK